MKVEIVRSALKGIERLPNEVLSRVQERIRALGNDPMPSDSMKLRRTEGYRVRVGDYRIIYTLDVRERKVTVIGVKHRREAYR